jgi:hypothetical protein
MLEFNTYTLLNMHDLVRAGTKQIKGDTWNCLGKKRNKKQKQLMRWKRERGIERPRQEDKARIETTRELSWAA